MSRNWIIAGVAAVCLAVGIDLSHRIERGVRVQKVTLAEETPALEFVPAGTGPHSVALLERQVKREIPMKVIGSPINHEFPNSYVVMTAVTLDLVLRYAFFGGVAWLLAYMIFKRRWFRRKIIPHFPASSEIRREFAYSILSMVIFGLVGTATIAMALHGWTRIYWRIGDYGWAWFWGSIVCVIFLHDAYFYWTHRLMHHRWLFRWFHALHHRSQNPSPWASYAFDPLEAVVQAGIFPLAIMLMPIHPLAFSMFMLWQIIHNVLGHAGYEIYPRWLMNTWFKRVLNTATNHVMHHEKMRGNYGIYFNFWDRMMGTNHADYEKRFLEVTKSKIDVRPEKPIGGRFGNE